MNNDPSQWIHSGLTCREVADRASEYLDNRLPILVHVRIGLHIASCTSCRVYMAQLRLVAAALRGLPQLYPSAVNHLRLRKLFVARHTNRSVRS